MSPPRFSVVIPAYNGSLTIGATIRSVLSQSEPRLELIVVDDGSSDGTPAIVRSFAAADPRVRLLEQANQGVAAARNVGIAQASADFVSFLDNDDLWMPRYLAAMGAALEAAPDAGLSFADGWALHDAIRRIRRETLFAGSRPPLPLPPDAGTQLIELSRDNYIWGSITARRTVLEEVGGFDSEVNAVDDYDLWLRILAAGHRAVVANGRLILQRARPDSVSHDQLMMLERTRDVCRRLAANQLAPDEARTIAAARVSALGRTISALQGAGGAAARWYRARRVIAGLRARLLERRLYPRRPPDEVAEAFPDLERL